MKSPILPLVSSLLCFLLVACGGGRPSTDNPTRGSISGVVYVTGSVAGAVVSAFSFDTDTGELGELIAASEPTSTDGAFHVELGNWDGEVLLIARGAGASYVEPASGANANFESSTVLRAFPVRWDDAQIQLHFGFEQESDVTSVVISPWSELAVDYATDRKRIFFEPYLEARDEAYRLVRDHLEIDFFHVVPRSFIDDNAVAAWDERAQAGLLGSALSYLARRIAVASSVAPSSLSSLALLEALKTDLNASGAVLDGAGNAGFIELGACPDDIDYCTLSSRTLRGGLAEAGALFLFDEQINKSGFVVNDVRTLLERISMRQSPLFAGPGSPVDGTPPIITITDLNPAEIVNGTKTFTVEVRDAFEVGEVSAIRFTRGTAQSWVEGQDDSLFSVERSETLTLHRLIVTVQSDTISDGDITLEVEAFDKAALDLQGAPTSRELQVTFDNSPAGTLAGVVTIGGRVEGAEVSIFDHTDGVLGRLLGTAITDSSGYYSAEVAESPSTTSLLIVAGKPVATTASYVEMVNGATVQLSAGDSIEALIADWTDGENRTVHLSPWTHVASVFSRALWRTQYEGRVFFWDDAVTDAHARIEDHLHDGAPIDLRLMQPALMTDSAQVQTFNAEVRYGLSIAGLGELAAEHAAASEATVALMNTLTLTRLLAADLANDSADPTVPLLDGNSVGGALSHGDVPSTSYWTRIDLAVAMRDFIVFNLQDGSSLVESDILSFLDRVSLDENELLYPGSEDGSLFDQTVPGPITFESPTPSEDTVLKGSIQLRVRARDDRELRSLEWITPAGITNVTPDRTAGRANWVLTGDLSLAAVPDGELQVTVLATDSAGGEATATRTIIVDTTAPSVAIGDAVTLAGVLPSGGWTGSTTLANVSGTVSDANGATAQYRWNAGAWNALALSGSSWSLSNLDLVGGANTLEVRATDPAANSRSVSATFYRDATPPVVDDAASAIVALVVDEGLFAASISGGGAGEVFYDVGGATTRQVLDGAVFTKWADRYTGVGPNLPEWRWVVSDNRTAAAELSTEYRLRQGGATLVDWSPLSGVAGAGYDRSLIVSSAVHANVNQVSGVFEIDARATDEFGNTSAPFTVSWTQTIINPAIRVSAPADKLSPSDSRTTGYYNLGSPNGTGPANNFASAVSGAVPGGRIRARVWKVDNPNSIPARVKISPALSTSYQRGLIYGTPSSGSVIPSGWGQDKWCAPNGYGDILEDGTCYSLPDPKTTEALMSFGVLVFGLQWDWIVTDSSGDDEIGPCAGCAADERELAPGTSILVYARTPDLAFVDAANASSYKNVAQIGSQSPVAGVDEALFRGCDSPRIVNGNPVCLAYSVRHAVRHLTRVRVTFGGNTSVQSRPGTAGTFTTAPGIPSAAGHSYYINEAETGYSNTAW